MGFPWFSPGIIEKQIPYQRFGIWKNRGRMINSKLKYHTPRSANTQLGSEWFRIRTLTIIRHKPSTK